MNTDQIMWFYQHHTKLFYTGKTILSDNKQTYGTDLSEAVITYENNRLQVEPQGDHKGKIAPLELFLYDKEEWLSKEQRRLSKKQKGSKNRFKQRLKVRKIQNKIKDTRKDFLHKTSNSITKNYDGIVVEDINIKGMMKNHCLAKSIGDVSWSEFNRQLEYKCKWSFKHYLKIGRFEPTSKTCSNCGCVQEMPLSKRIFDCPDCGISIDRDLNASLNIRNIGFNTLGHSEIYACEDGLLELSLKQEKECLENQAEATGLALWSVTKRFLDP